MSRFEQEWALVPAAARWLAALASLAFAALMAAIFLLPGYAPGTESRSTGRPIFLVTAASRRHRRSRSTCCWSATSTATRGAAG